MKAPGRAKYALSTKCECYIELYSTRGVQGAKRRVKLKPCYIALVKWGLPFRVKRGMMKKKLYSTRKRNREKGSVFMYLSCDMSLKLSADGSYHHTGTNHGHNDTPGTGGLEGYGKYMARDVDLANGEDIYGYHEPIDKARTPDNETWYKDENGKWQRCTDSSQISEAVERRLNDVQTKRCLGGKTVILQGRKGMRGNACIVRPIVLQGSDDTDFYLHGIEHLEKKFGAENIVGFSIHRDETSVHCHVLVVPVTDDNRLDQTKILPSTKSQMKKFHREFREYYRSKGYDVELENKPDDETVVRDSKGRKKRLSKEAHEKVVDAQKLCEDMASECVATLAVERHEMEMQLQEERDSLDAEYQYEQWQLKQEKEQMEKTAKAEVETAKADAQKAVFAEKQRLAKETALMQEKWQEKANAELSETVAELKELKDTYRGAMLTVDDVAQGDAGEKYKGFVLKTVKDVLSTCVLNSGRTFWDKFGRQIEIALKMGLQEGDWRKPEVKVQELKQRVAHKEQQFSSKKRQLSSIGLGILEKEKERERDYSME